MKHYTNPRLDFNGQTGNAEHGKVQLDWIKTIWVCFMLILGTAGSLIFFTWSGLVLFIITTLIVLCFGHSLGMHRLFIHKSYQTSRFIELLFIHLGTLVGIAGPISMLRTHDTRDWAQRQNKCHTYFSHAQIWYRDMIWQLFCRIDPNHPPEILVEHSIANDPIIAVMERTWMLQQLPWAILFYYFGGLSWVCFGIGSRVTACVFGHWLIGYFAHNTGDKTWHVEGAAAQGFNVTGVSLLTMGECWHNNHHAFPGSAKLGLKHGEWDPGWWVLKIMQRLNLVWNLVLPADLDHRPELRHRQEI